MMQIVIWARVSSREQKEGYSIDAQLRACRERAAKHDWTVVREFVCAESAKRGATRNAFNRMFQWVRQNARREKIDAILSHKLDRVCRNMRDAVRLQELEDDCGVRLSFVENQFGPGAAGALSFNVMAAVAQYYSDNLRSEVLKGIDEKVRQGWPTGHAPFGYLNVADKEEPIIPHPERSKTLYRIFELYATGSYTFKTLADRLRDEGHIFRPSVRRFYRTTLSYILNNRFYIGEITRNGQVFQGRYRLVVPRPLFEACQDVLHGRNRRSSTHTHLFNGGILRCGICGFALTSEVIRRQLKGGGVREHIYYRCGNNHPEPGHPRVRWREDRLEAAIKEDLGRMRLPAEVADWFRKAIQEAFADVEALHRKRKAALAKRKTEIANMLERLLDAYLLGAVEEGPFKAKTGRLKGELAEVEASLAEAVAYDPEAPQRALAVFDFSQSLVDGWERSNLARKRELLDAVSLNRTVTDVSLVLTKRKPFDFLAEGPELKDGRGDWRSFEPGTRALRRFLAALGVSRGPGSKATGRLRRLSA